MHKIAIAFSLVTYNACIMQVFLSTEMTHFHRTTLQMPPKFTFKQKNAPFPEQKCSLHALSPRRKNRLLISYWNSISHFLQLCTECHIAAYNVTWWKWVTMTSFPIHTIYGGGGINGKITQSIDHTQFDSNELANVQDFTFGSFLYSRKDQSIQITVRPRSFSRSPSCTADFLHSWQRTLHALKLIAATGFKQQIDWKRAQKK